MPASKCSTTELHLPTGKAVASPIEPAADELAFIDPLTLGISGQRFSFDRVG